ncbi:glycosyltransferase, partial [Bordetella hinzii]|nr:glycosyltransferase [Bordetella hinzii]
MKILYTNFHPRNGGGHVTYIINLARALASDHDIVVATPQASRLYRYAQAIGRVRVAPMDFTTRLSSWFGGRQRLRRLIAQEKFDIVHCNGSADHKLVMLATLGMRRRPRIIFTKHNDHPLDSLGNALRARLATD